MSYTEITNRNSPNFTAGRSGRNITGITIHWWGDPNQNPQAENVVNWLCNPASQVSAHYVATGTGRRVWCLVNDKDTAWHAGNWEGNCTTLGIECDPRCRDEDYDVVAELVADMWRYYGKLPLYPHKHWFGTACPGNYDLNRIARLAETKLNPPKPQPTPQPKPQPKPQINMVKLDSPIDFKTKIDAKLWDLTTAPNWKSIKTIAKGETFRAYGKAEYMNSTYYITEYSFKKNKPNGVNAVDLVKPEPPKPPQPQPKPETPKNEENKTITNPQTPKNENVVKSEKSELAEIKATVNNNNKLLTQIMEMLTNLINKITRIFK